MATKFYNVEKVAEILGVAPSEVNAMREKQELHGYRDGADWKFKADEVDQLAAKKAAGDAPDSDADDEDVILSEVELGESDPSTSGTVIGPPPADALGSSLSGFDDLNLEGADSGLDVSDASSLSGLSDLGAVSDLGGVSDLSGVSELDLAGSGLDDDDLVLGASGTGSGSDLTIGGDSGISLLDPTDSGLSLEEPLDLISGSQESLTLGEDEVLALDKRADTEAPTELAGDSDFLLTPMDELTDGEEESSSQVIALDEEGDSGELAEVTPMLDGDVGEPVAQAMSFAEPMPLEVAASKAAAAPAGIMPDYSVAQPEAAGVSASGLSEAPYSALNIAGLVFCTVVLFIVGMMMYDLMRNMWSWNQPTPVNSWLMDLILGR
ncbi:MAG: helix-turn-helix domain-containing protein [Pirellulales bacterium]|nr:helix-turn-helix domain-containing protein [Pirellulales bacterium]